MSTSPHPTDTLSAYVDGDLSAAETSAVAAHVASCLACQKVVLDIERLRDRVRGWTHDEAEPMTDLWPAVATRLSAPEHATGGSSSLPRHVHRGRWYQRRITVGVPALALAATLVAALGGVVISQRSARVAAPPPVVAVLAEIEPLDAAGAGVVTASFSDAQYDAAVADLEGVLRDHRDRLNPRTVFVLERSLRVVDEAVQEARAALADDPANPLLNAQLADVRRRKLQLLRQATSLTEGV